MILTDLFSDDFYLVLSIITTALDNIKIRRYIDGWIIQARTSFIYTGTNIFKWNIQVVLPFKVKAAFLHKSKNKLRFLIAH